MSCDAQGITKSSISIAFLTFSIWGCQNRTVRNKLLVDRSTHVPSFPTFDYCFDLVPCSREASSSDFTLTNRSHFLMAFPFSLCVSGLIAEMPVQVDARCPPCKLFSDAAEWLLSILSTSSPCTVPCYSSIAVKIIIPHHSE